MKISVNHAEAEVKQCPIKKHCSMSAREDKPCNGKEPRRDCPMLRNGVTFRLMGAEFAE